MWRALICLSSMLIAAVETKADGDKGSPTAISGRVESSGLAVEHARVVAVDHGLEVFTDGRGNFEFENCPLPCALTITHPRFHAVETAVETNNSNGLEITLHAKQEVYEHVDVTASRGGSAFAPASVASTVIKVADKAASPSTLTELVEGVAGVAENGQGGIFQVFSIRGVSRHRVLTLVAGVPIIGERRAGVSTSFIDPTLMGSADVLRGPASTYYGSGALGGVVQVFPRTFERGHFEAGYDSFGNTNYQRIGWGESTADSGWSFGLAHRTADNDNAPDGSELNTHYTQLSAAITRSWSAGGLDYEIQALPSYGRDIGKSNSDFPGRTTNYPRETHLLLRFGIRSDGSRGESGAPWQFNAFVHPNSVITEDLRQGSRLTEIDNEAFDFGANWQREWSLANRAGSLANLSGRYGVDFVGRRSVNADERREDLVDGSVTRLRTLDGGSQDEAAVYGSARWNLGAATFQAGSRLTFQQQKNARAPSRNDTAWTAFLGYVRPLGGGLEIAANLGTGLRFPNLSERFFTGTTGRGGVIGNPDLDAESSVTGDLGLRWYGDQTFLSAQVFHQTIDDYIERVEVDDDLLTFVNLTSGSIAGFEIEGFHQLSEPWLLSWSGHLIDGEDDNDNPLADIPANRLQIGIGYARGDWDTQLQVQFRASKDDPGSGEVAIPATQLVSASIGYQVRPDLTLTLRGRNLLDEEYFNSADDKATLSPGRSVGLSLSWSGF